jgi:hypothetical protein
VYLHLGGFTVSTSATQAQARYDKKRGLVCKTYKLPRETVEAFAEVCEEREESPAAVLAKYMRYYAKKYGDE